MPKLIDWGVRFDLVREAIVRVAAREGAAAVNFTSVAAELKLHPGTIRRSVEAADVLPHMGMAHIAGQRSRRNYLRGRRGHEYASLGHISWVLRALVPMGAEELEEERAWRALTSAPLDERCSKIRRSQDAEIDALVRSALLTWESAPGSVGHPAIESQATESQAIELQAFELRAIGLRALIDGLVAARCRADLSPEQAVECLEVHLLGLRRAPGREQETSVSPDASGSPR